MSDSSKRGKRLELEVAKILRSKLGARVTRDKQSGAGLHKQDIFDYGGDIPFSIEAKDQATLKVKEWFRQAVEASSFNQVPTLVFRSDQEILACVRFADLVNLAVEIKDLQAKLDDIRGPVQDVPASTTSHLEIDQLLDKPVKAKVEAGARTDREGHLVDQWGYCNIIGCKYNRSYRPPKAKRS
jgi:Holliday junction resolvase